MAHRLIRDDVLDSERVHALAPAGRWLYVSLLLLADDVGLLELNSFKIGRKSGIEDAEQQGFLRQMIETDLIRTYVVAGKRFAFIPRFRQRLQIKRSKCPLPPAELLSDDPDAFNKIKVLESVSAVVYRKSTVGQPPEPEPEPKRKRNPPTPKGALVGFENFWKAWPKSPRKGGLDKCRQVWTQNGLEGQAGAILAHVGAMAASKAWTKEGGQFVPGPVVYLRSTAWTGADLDLDHANHFSGAI